MNIKRDLYQDLIKWKNKKNRKPLLLQGARQVGKTWLLKHFGTREFKKLAYFNFEEQPELRQFFEISKKPARILENLAIVNEESITPENTLIIFDEIQECNEALNSLKYFRENAPEYPVIGSGSLLGITLSGGKSFPVGQVDFLTLYPVTFREYLRAAEPGLYDFLDSISEVKPIPDIFFHHLLEKLKLYFIIGGMPEAIRSMLENGDIREIKKIQDNILNAYRLDFTKHVPGHLIPKINYVWSSIPSQLARENKKFLYQSVKTGARAREYENALLWLKQAGLVHIVHKIRKPSIPLSAYADLSAFKVYLLDVGLLRQMSNLYPGIIQQGNILFTEFKGALAENFVLQSLVALFKTEQYYWTSGNKAEVDFLLQYNNMVIPAEVKAATNIRSKSLLSYAKKYSPEIKIRFSLKNLSLDNRMLNIPLFMADDTQKLLETVL